MGKKSNTGNYKSRVALVQNVNFFYYSKGLNIQAVSIATGVNEAIVCTILRRTVL